MSLAFTVAIPARLAATRLPGKPLRLLAGRPIIRHVIDRALESEADEIVLATDSEAIAAAAAGATIRVEFTRPDHPSGTDRLAEVAERLAWARDRIVVNLQGDEPLIPASAIRAVARALADSPDCAIATLYFSRAPIPWPRDAFSRDRSRLPEGLPAWRHVGLYAYRAGFLRDYPRLSPGPLESVESLEQLRALSAGERIRVIRSPVEFPPGIDTEADLARVERLFARSAPGGE
jgi:3-deoxy-manno-octulosonate cytidylyltransferase (CMP-KDO synthetase)